MNVVNVRVDRVSYRMARRHSLDDLRASISNAVREGGGFVRLETIRGGDVYVMCSPGVPIVVTAYEEAEVPEASLQSLEDDLDVQYDLFFDQLL